jgi:hypothetical protein
MNSTDTNPEKKLNIEDLRYEVQRQDGSAESSTRAMELIVSAYNEVNYIPKSIEIGFFEEFSKTIMESIGKGDEKNLLSIYQSLENEIKKDDDFISPFAGSTSKKRFGANLQVMQDFVEVYLRSDLEIKDQTRIAGTDAKTTRMKGILSNLLEKNKSDKENDQSSDEITNAYFDNLQVKPDDIDGLVIWGFLRRHKKEKSEEIVYTLTNKSKFYQDKVQISDKVTNNVTTDDEELTVMAKFLESKGYKVEAPQKPDAPEPK